MQFDFERLTVYKKSLNFIDDVFCIYRNLNHEYKYSIGQNLVRAALSIANNIAEGNDRKSQKEKARFFEISSGSTRECVSVLNILKRQNLIQEKYFVQLRVNAREITSMLYGLTKLLK